MKKKIALIFCLLNIGIISAQSLTQTIRGKVYDRESEFTLPGASVVLQSINPVKGVSTDANGDFEIKNVPVGRHTLKISFVGYDDIVVPNVLVGSAKEVILKIPLTESIISLDEVVISGGAQKGEANNEMATVSARSFSMEEANRYAASVDDPARIAQSFAGVSTTDDVSNEIIVRGNSPRGILWRINGIEVPSPNHFTDIGASGGGISMLSNNRLDNSDFLTGAFPAEYGNALSGVFDIELRKGNQYKAERAFQLGVLGTDLSVEGPFSGVNKGSYLINYRYSTLALLENSGILNTGENNIFQDLSFNFFLPTEKAGNFSLFGVGGLSTSEEFVPKDTADWEGEQEAYDSRFVSNMGVVGIDHKYFFNEETYLKTVLSYSGQEIAFEEDSVSRQNLSSNLLYDEEMINSSIRLTSYLNKKLSSKSTIRTGLIGSKRYFNLYSRRVDEETNKLTTFVENEGQTEVYQLYGQWKYRFHEKWTLNAGLHSLYFALNKNLSVEPRLGLMWAFTEGQSLSFGFGVHSKIEDMSVYFAEQQRADGTSFQPNKNLDLTKALHYVVGYSRMLNENLHLKTELYFQHLYNVPVENAFESSVSAINLNAGYITNDFVNEGTAYNVGAELTLERFFSDKYYYLFTASVFDSKYKAINGEEYNTRFNANYRFTLLGGKEYAVGKSKKNLLGINIKGIWSGGNRYTPINLEASRASGETKLFEERQYEEKVPDYWRVDITTSFRINREKTAHIISFQGQNITGRENTFSYYYDDDTRRIEESKQFGLLPVLKYRIEF